MIDTDSWTGFGIFALLILLLLFLPFLVALFGRGPRWKVLALALCIAATLLTGIDVPAFICWLGGWVCAGLAIRTRIRARAVAGS